MRFLRKWFRNLPHLPSQVLNPFGAKNFNIRPLPRIMSFMIWSPKTWTQVNMIVKTWQPQVWNLTPFVWRLGMPSFEMLHFCNSMSPSLDNDCTIQDVAFQVFKLVGVTNFNIRPLPRIMSFMTWPSKTWAQLEKVFQDLAATFLKSNTLCSRLGMPSFVMLLHFFCNSMSPSLEQWLPYSRFGFPSLDFFWRYRISSV